MPNDEKSVLDLLWNPDGARRRGPKRSMDLAGIVAAAIAIADEAGLEAVSMAAVAKRLGYTTMSLYRYIASKDDLLMVMRDTAYGAPTSGPAPDWREMIRQWAWAIRERYQAHPWILDIPISGPPLAPNQLLWLEHFLEGLAGTKLTDHEALATALLVSGYVLNQARLERDVQRGEVASGQPHEEAIRSVLDTLAARGTYPRVLAVMAQGEFEDGDEDEDGDFIFGLERIIDGIAVLAEASDR